MDDQTLGHGDPADFKFSAAVAGIGLLLRDSAYKGTLGWETARKLARDGKGADKLGCRASFCSSLTRRGA